MFDILVYLFENYYDAESFPDQDTLARKLSAAGFDADDIGQALDWLTGLDRDNRGYYPDRLADSSGVRFYSETESRKLNAESRGFLAFLESADVLTPMQRELVIDRVLALDENEVSVEKVKLIVLIVLSTQKQSLDSLLLGELLSSNGDRYIH